jgi:hypothetical protein
MQTFTAEILFLKNGSTYTRYQLLEEIISVKSVRWPVLGLSWSGLIMNMLQSKHYEKLQKL